MKSPLKMAVFSDIHLGHMKNDTADIIKNLDNAMKDKAWLRELDVLFLSGDVFDRLLYLPEDSSNAIRLWISHMLRMCAEYDIILRVLEGTPSHDWGQPELFISTNVIGDIKANVKYQSTLCIEHIPE